MTKQFPLLLHAIADGELHLTGLLMIGPHLTPDNHVDVLARAKFRTKKELAKLVRELHPLPHIPDRIEPLGPQAACALRNPTWEEFVTSLAPRVRELPPGERPRDWANDACSLTLAGASGGGDGTPDCAGSDEALPLGANDGDLPLGPVPRDLPPVTAPQQYQVQFSTVEEHASLVERARALLSRERPGVSLGELHLEAMKLLVASLEKRKFAVMDAAPRQRGTKRDIDADIAPRQRGATTREPEPTPRQRGERDARVAAAPPRQRGTTSEGSSAPPRSRYVPAAERREVDRRDGGRCTYVDARGERCVETGCLELHHLQPFAQNGPNMARNLTLRCPAHNALAAEQDFGRELMAERRQAFRHERQSAQPVPGGDD